MKKRQKVRYGGANLITGIVYTCVISFAMMYTICRQELLICTVIMCAAASAVYMALFSLHKKPIGSQVMTLVLTAACFGVIFALSMMFMEFVSGAGGGNLGEDSFIYFLFTASAKFTAAHAATAILLFSVVIGFICCYFSVTMPRIGFLLLPALIPLILSTRTSQGLPMWLIVLLISSYLMAAVCIARPIPAEGEVFSESGMVPRRAAAAACLAAVVTLAAAALPKSEETVFEQYLDAFSLSGTGFFRGTGTLGNFAVRSSVNNGNNTPSDVELFTVYTDTPATLDRCVFDVCGGAKGWTSLEVYETGYPDWESSLRACRPSELFNALKLGVQDGKLEEYAEVLSILPETETKTGSMLIQVSEESDTAVVLHPMGTYSVEVEDYYGAVYRTPRGELFTAYNIKGGRYLLQYSLEQPVGEYAQAAAAVDFEQLLYDAAAEEVISGKLANAFINELSSANSYRLNAKNADKTDTAVMLLADEITEGCTNDYEKAVALEKWFSQQGFVYDMDFVPESAEPTYFLFESKRGICSDFATSLTLLARAAGLSARYVEGFTLTSDIQDENGVYHVTEANSHAYSQIYVAGCGWLTFDATRYIPQAVEEDVGDKVLAVLIIAAGITAVLLVLMLIFRKPLSRLWFAVTYPLRSKPSQIKGVYLRARELCSEISGRAAETTTVGETRRVLANVLMMPDEADRICDAADSLLYSPDEKVCADTKQLYLCLKRLYQRKRGLK